MAVTQVRQELNAARRAGKMEGYAVGGRRFDLLSSLLSMWIVVGLYLDGSAHHHIPELIESFFTPWHAVLYSGFAASAGLLLVTQWRNVSKGYRWVEALPKGYLPSLAGSVIFIFAGGGDFLWHSAFGFEVGLEALVSPTHLALAAGGILMISGPLRATLHRTSGKPLTGWGELLPVLLSLLGILSVLAFFLGEYSLNTYPNLIVYHPGTDNTFLYDIRVLASVLIPSALLMGIVLFALRHWTLPLGSLTFLIVGNSLLLTWFHLKEVYPFPQTLLAVALSGMITDVLYKVLRPSSDSIRALRLFAFSVPATLFALFFVMFIRTTGIWWSIHLWTGAVFLAGVVGLLLSYLTHPFKQ